MAKTSLIGKSDLEKRFHFGKNWSRFLSLISDERIAEAETSLKQMLELERMDGLRFLDIGSGSGIFSLAARRLGASVHSFDYDPLSVACTKQLRDRYYPTDPAWSIDEASVLDSAYMESLGRFDVVYSWGVLHHTAAMMQALANASIPVAEGGSLFIAIYNDQGATSRRWREVKRLYCARLAFQWTIVAALVPYYLITGITADLLRRRNPLKRYRDYRRARGMSAMTDWLDWFGGYPFEVAKPEEILDFYREQGFTLVKLKTCGGTHGNNEFVFLKSSMGMPTCTAQ